MLSNSLLGILCSFVMLPLAWQSVQAEETVELPRQLISATRTLEEPFNLPFSTEIISEPALSDFAPRTVADSLEQSTSVMLQRTGYGQVSPFIRGYTGFRTLMLIDGIRLNNSVFRSGPNQYWSTIDGYSLERLEIVKGPSGVLYGSDAIGGVVNAITSDVSLSSEANAYGGRVAGRVASAEQSYAGRAQASYQDGSSLGITAGATYRQFGDLIGGGTVEEQNNTAYSESAADFKAAWLVQPHLTITTAFQHFAQNNVPRTHSTTDGIRWSGLSAGTDKRRDLDQERNLGYIQANLRESDGFIQDVLASVSWQQQTETEDRIRANSTRGLQSFSVNTLGNFLTLHSECPVGKLTYGYEYYHDWVSSQTLNYAANGNFTSAGIQGPVADDSSYDLFGVFIQDEYKPVDRVTLIGGIRWNYASADLGRYEDPVTKLPASTSDSWSQFAGSLRSLWDVDGMDRFHLYAGVSQGFRAPNLSDLSRLDIARSGELETPSPNLESEKYTSYEVGMKTRFSSAVEAEMAYFYTESKDEIISVPTGNTLVKDGKSLVEVRKTNAANGHVQGVETTLIWKPDTTVRFKTALTWQDGQVESYQTLPTPGTVVEPASRLMPLKAAFSGRYAPTDLPVWMELVFTISAKADRLSTSDKRDTERIPPGGTPGYEVLSFYTGWNIGDNARITFSVENIFDRDYRIHGSGVNAPGRNFVGAFDWRF
ncbi:MAG: TonB-dependent receptor [Verrucomicrobiota bacterium]|nr:TonB-dependent receptor [Verrucomicrobiota bacterium]